ncbi:RNA methyltransferase [Olivibacter sp. SDN3]|uniref:methyltransferase RsmF C-terminal domain-like protein n=1 Tax=Olivibacter sp. SDN3 TaxID=2764720 RepID=UPI0016517E7D|nr:RNA methyltransferase [Olivibacter sp. SDN3]QNL50537.1 RNA methyltransferase [Olivibacter sp. SDN3]
MANFLPHKLVADLQREFHINAEQFIQEHETGEQITSVRINPAKQSGAFNNLSNVPWCKEGYYLNARPVFTLDPLFHAGTYYVQEASSMFISHIIKTILPDKTPSIVLDLCAAPGGKSTLLNSTLHSDSLLVANEIIKTRVGTLADNLTKWGNINTIVTNNDPASFSRLPGYFDLMLVDAPCSGSGMFRKDPQTINQWSEESVKLCSQRQQRILADSLIALKENGILIYSTCSYSVEENEAIADWLCDHYDMESIQIPIDSNWGIDETLSPKHQCYGYRFYPGKLKGEGFFTSCFIKKESQHTFNRKKIKSQQNQVDSSIFRNWIKADIDSTLFSFKEDILLFPRHQLTALQIIQNVLYLKKVGTKVGKVNKRDVIPHHELALSNYQHTHIQKVELSLTTALQYLRKADIAIETSISGWALACYHGFALGWMKVLPNRINNYYPKDWRIFNL